MDLEVSVLQRQRGIGRHAAGRVAIARKQEIQPDWGVDVGSRLEILRICFQAHSGEDDHHKHRVQAGPGMAPSAMAYASAGWCNLTCITTLYTGLSHSALPMQQIGLHPFEMHADGRHNAVRALEAVAQATIPDDRVEQHRTVYGDRRYFGGFTTIYVTWLPCVAG